MIFILNKSLKNQALVFKNASKNIHSLHSLKACMCKKYIMSIINKNLHYQQKN